jgi:hypothetical protein
MKYVVNGRDVELPVYICIGLEIAFDPEQRMRR